MPLLQKICWAHVQVLHPIFLVSPVHKFNWSDTVWGGSWGAECTQPHALGGCISLLLLALLRTAILLGTGSKNPSLCSSSFFTTCFSFPQRLVWLLISSPKAALLTLAKHWPRDGAQLWPWVVLQWCPHRGWWAPLCPGDSLQFDHPPAWGARHSHPSYTRIHTSCKQQKGRRSEATLRWEVISLQHLSVMSFTSSVKANRAERFWHQAYV